MAMHVIRIDEKGRALDHVVRLSKSGNDNVLWVALGNGGPWTITFDKAANPENPFNAGSPFSAAVYVLPNQWFVGTINGLKATTAANQIYKYNVKNAAGIITDDPDVDIDA